MRCLKSLCATQGGHNQLIWEGSFKEDYNHITWKLLHHHTTNSLKFTKNDILFCFKLKDKVYIAKQKSLDRYDLTTGIYREYICSFPSTMCRMHAAATDEYETFALMTNRESMLGLLFTENEEFHRITRIHNKNIQLEMLNSGTRPALNVKNSSNNFYIKASKNYFQLKPTLLRMK